MDELVLGGKKYISSKRASEVTGYAKDYIGQLARLEKVPATRIGRAWYVDEAALLLHEGTNAESGTELQRAITLDDSESFTVGIRRGPDSKIIPSVSHALLGMSRNLPDTWTPVTYLPDDRSLFPTNLQQSPYPFLMNQNKEISAIQEKNALRIRILQRKVGLSDQKSPSISKPVVQQRPGKEVSMILPAKKAPQLIVVRRKRHTRVPYVLLGFSATALILLVLSSGFLVASHVTFTQDTDLYSANAYLSYQYVRDTISEVPALQTGYGTLRDFFSFIIGSSSELFLKGVGFLNWLINLV